MANKRAELPDCEPNTHAPAVATVNVTGCTAKIWASSRGQREKYVSTQASL